MRLIPSLLAFLLSAAANAYELGQGLQGERYYLSGYLNVEGVDRFDAPTKLDLDDLSLFAGGHFNQWVNPFMEMEYSHQTLIRQGGGGDNGDFVVERFYNDLKLSEQHTLRIGKILTPLGEWNLVHAAPLIPVINRPYTTAQGFDAYMTGFDWIYEPPGSRPGLQLYWQPDNEWFKRSRSFTIRNFHNVFGGHVNVPLGLLDKVGLSFQHGHLIETGETYTLYGLNLDKTFGRLGVQGEAITSRFSGAVKPGAPGRMHDAEYGVFGILDWQFSPAWHGILEKEHYQDHTMVATSRSTSATLAFKPSPPMVWKLEYTYQAGESASIAPIHTGFKASLT